MPDQITVTFLGTAAGKPCETRNVSSLALKLDHTLWVVDAGEGTQHQLMSKRCKLKMSQISKIFITHMHGDHTMGLPGLLCTISAGEGHVLADQVDDRLDKAAATPARPTEIYGPKGLRAFLRHSLTLTYSLLSRPYTVHELLFPNEEPSPQSPEDLHTNERLGRDVIQRDGVWKHIDSSLDVDISAGPILHTAPCIGYVFTESPRPLPLIPSLYIPHLQNPINAAALKASGIVNPLSLLSRLTRERQPITLADGTVLSPPALGGPGRKVVILGDTYDASGIADLATGADLLVHECTNAFLPELDDSQRRPNITLGTVRETARDHGHSIPEVVGDFARRIGARALVMNHLSVKYPHVDPEEKEEDTETVKMMRRRLREIERLAGVAWRREGARVANDFMTVEVKKTLLHEGDARS